MQSARSSVGISLFDGRYEAKRKKEEEKKTVGIDGRSGFWLLLGCSSPDVDEREIKEKKKPEMVVAH